MWKHLIYFSKVKPVVAEYSFDQEFNISYSKFNLKKMFSLLGTSFEFNWR